MNRLFIFFIFTLCKLTEGQQDKIIDLSYDHYDESEVPNHFINLTSSNLDNFVQNGKYNRWLLIFYSEDCKFCKHIITLVNKIIEEKEFKNDIKFGKVELTYNLRLQIRFNITKIPFIVLVTNYHMYEMKFLPTEESLTNFIDSDNFDQFKDFKKDFPQDLSFFDFIKNLIDFAFKDGTKRLNIFLKKKNISFQFTPLLLFMSCMIIGVPIATIFYIYIFGVLCRKDKKPIELEKNLNEKDDNKNNNNNTNNGNEEEDENKKIKKE